MFFREIARRWAKLTAEPPETMMSALVAGWWRGQLPNPEGKDIRPGALELLVTFGRETRIQPFAEEQPDGGMIYNFWPKITLRARPAELPSAELEAAYSVLAQVLWEDYPGDDARTGITLQRVSRVDFALWYAGADLWPKPDLLEFWPTNSSEAENLCDGLGLGLAGADPFAASYWSLGQVVAWVMCRRPEAVRQLSHDAEARYHVEIRPGQTAEVTGGRNPAYYLASLSARFGLDERRVIPRDSAEQEVKAKLEAGELCAYGLRNSQGDLQEIPTFFWADARIAESRNLNMRPQLFAESLVGVTFFTEVRCLRKDVLRWWPNEFERVFSDDETIEDIDTTSGKPTAAAEKKCAKWLTALMEKGTCPQYCKAQYRKEAQEKFGVSARGFNRGWGNAVAETGNAAWSTPGRKRDGVSIRQDIVTPI